MLRLLAAGSAHRLAVLCAWLGRTFVIGARRLNAASRWFHDAECWLSGLGSWSSLRGHDHAGPRGGGR